MCHAGSGAFKRRLACSVVVLIAAKFDGRTSILVLKVRSYTFSNINSMVIVACLYNLYAPNYIIIDYSFYSKQVLIFYHLKTRLLATATL